MKKQFVTYLALLLTLNGCLVYDNRISWEDSSNISHYDYRDADTSNFQLQLTFDRENRFMVFPFVFSETHKKRPLYHPTVHMTSMDHSIVKFFDLDIEILTVSGAPIFKEEYKDTIVLNAFDNFNANQHLYKVDLISRLKETNDTILINYSVRTIDRNGVIDTVENQGVKYIKTRHKRFGSFL